MSDSVEKWVWVKLEGGQSYDVPISHAWEPGSCLLVCMEKVGDGVGQRKEVSVANLEEYKISVSERAEFVVARKRSAELEQKEQAKIASSSRRVFLDTMQEMIQAVQIPSHMLWMDERRTVFFWVPSDYQFPEGRDKLGTMGGWVHTDQSALTGFQIDRNQANIYAQQIMDARAQAEKQVARKVLEILPEEPQSNEPDVNLFEALDTTPEEFFGSDEMLGWWEGYKKRFDGDAAEAGRQFASDMVEEAQRIRSACEDILRK
jgi:hypothetical protein